MKIFITGSTGYIGYHLTQRAFDLGFEVTALVRKPSLNRGPKHPSLSVYQGDISDFNAVVESIKKCDVAFHAAALTQLWDRDASLFYRINVEGTKNVLEAAVQTGVKKVVFTSSCAVLGPSTRPVKEEDERTIPFENDYERSKHQAEELVKAYVAKGLQVVIVRPPRVFGPGLLTKGNPINRLIRSTISRGIAFIPSAKDVVGNYGFINDVVNGHFLALENGKSGEAYNIGGENISYERFFSTLASSVNKKIKIIIVPIPLLKAWARIVFTSNYLIGRQTHISPKVIDRLLQSRAVSCEKAISDLSYRITPFAQAMQMTIEHLQARK